MSLLSEIEPKDKPNVIVLVESAGIDVSDWANCNTYPSRNPKYCYRWAFVKLGKVVILNLWHDHMEEARGRIIMRSLNMRRHAKNVSEPNRSRAIEFDDAIKTALKFKLLVRVIILCRKKPTDETASKRGLDPQSWTITNYDWNTGECTLTRGTHQFADQFAIQEEEKKPERRAVLGQAFVRSLTVRSNVLLRANGKCEWCGKLGFKMTDGRIYLETHHVVPLSEDGADIATNVAALCPNHHREAHHGESKDGMRKKLLERLKRDSA
jgi:hypothetical protein